MYGLSCAWLKRGTSQKKTARAPILASRPQFSVGKIECTPLLIENENEFQFHLGLYDMVQERRVRVLYYYLQCTKCNALHRRTGPFPKLRNNLHGRIISSS